MIIYALVFLSGFSALIYQVLWMKQLGLLFGNTSHAAGATLAAFFAGLAVGSWFWGRRVAKSRNPIRIYAGLELGIAVTALLYFVVLKGYYAIYPSVYQNVHSAGLLLGVKFVLAMILIFPPAFCMGGTIPVIGQHAIRNPSRFGSTSALLYGINTLGATLGAFLAGFFMPLWLGFRTTCLGAMGVTVAVAALAFLVSKSAAASIAVDEDGKEGDSTDDAKDDDGVGRERMAHWVICFVSGFGVLALEVVWNRMFSQILENSVYTFSLILVIVLLSLAAGSLVSALLARMKWSPNRVLTVLLVVSGMAVATTPSVFMHVTDSFTTLAPKVSWSEYVYIVFGKGLWVIGPPAVILGTVFPYLMKTEERFTSSPGKSLGRLAAINTMGAILGSLACAFLFLEVFGMWRTMQIIGVVYFLIAVAVPIALDRFGIAVKAVSVCGVVLLLTALSPSGFQVTAVDPKRMDETTVKVYEGSDCTVSVVTNDSGMAIKINSHYGLGSTAGSVREVMQAKIPIMLKPDTKSVFFLGMGTGITAGGALAPEFDTIERVVVCELAADVIAAAREYMTDVDGEDFTNGLFDDPRVTVLAEDGRHYLMATKERFDLINADLFVPYRAGAGSLYTREHFESVKKRLNSGGLFVQWLPLYQLTENELFIIIRTMLDVFDDVSLWRNDFEAGNEVIAVVAHEGGTPLPPCDLDDGAIKERFVYDNDHGNIHKTLNPQTALLYYGGNLSRSKDLFKKYPINTDDRPLIEYMAPRSYRNSDDEDLVWYVGPKIIKLISDIQVRCPPKEDPLLANRSPFNRRLPVAANAYHKLKLWDKYGQYANTEQERAFIMNEFWKQFLANWLDHDVK